MVTTYRRCHLVVFGTVSHKAAVDLASLDRSHHHLLIALTAHVLFSTWSLHVAHPPGYQPTMHHRRGRDCHRLLACRRLAVIRSIMSSATLQSKADTCGGSHRLYSDALLTAGLHERVQSYRSKPATHGYDGRSYADHVKRERAGSTAASPQRDSNYYCPASLEYQPTLPSPGSASLSPLSPHSPLAPHSPFDTSAYGEVVTEHDSLPHRQDYYTYRVHSHESLPSAPQTLSSTPPPGPQPTPSRKPPKDDTQNDGRGVLLANLDLDHRIKSIKTVAKTS